MVSTLVMNSNSGTKCDTIFDGVKTSIMNTAFCAKWESHEVRKK